MQQLCSGRLGGPTHAPPRHTRPSHPSPRLICRSAAMDAPAAATLKTLVAQPITAEAFKPFGQVIGVTADGKQFDKEDAQLQGFGDGTPRFYVMRLPRRGLKFHRITYHAKVTQCLGVLAPVDHWYMVVAKPSGSVDNYPREGDLHAFRIPHGVYVKMEKGTWHAGPLFDQQEHMDFYNLELSDTNVTDHNTHDYKKAAGIEYLVTDSQ